MKFASILKVSASGMDAQTLRMRMVAENIANAEVAPNRPGEDPYRRKMLSFRNVLDREHGVRTLRADKVVFDKRPFLTRYEPANPSADGAGYVKIPNVNSLIESMDMRQAQRSYEANLGVIEVAKNMISRTIDILRS
ncbi:MAG: flagellar basal body rod protein FlgC [Rhodospirillales bacterium]|jgi:flagellar basal-body rod protein FlgC